MKRTERRRLRGWRLLPAVAWLVVFGASTAGSSFSVATDLPGSQILAAGAGSHTPGVRVAESDDQRPSVAPPMVVCRGAISIEPGFTPWPSPVGAGSAPRSRPVLPVAPKTSPPHSSIES